MGVRTATAGRAGWKPRTLPLAAVCAALLGAGACETGLDPTPDDGSPPGPDVRAPFPIDRGDEGIDTPGKYKGLWLRLVNNGEPEVTSVDGIIGVVCLGMSDAADECADFVARINSHWLNEVAGDVVVLNCSREAFGVEHWIDPAYDDETWGACLYLLMPFLGIRPEQIRVVYHKAANHSTVDELGRPLPPYPDSASNYHRLYRNLGAFSERLKTFFPNVQAVYTSSRAYGGYARVPGRGEPVAYEEGHAVNSWLADNPTVGGVWYGWGAYVWAPPCLSDEVNGAGVCFEPADFDADGVHRSGQGRGKISWMMHQRLLHEGWYRR